jgi:choline dehydrogenase-like flavoprotein
VPHVEFKALTDTSRLDFDLCIIGTGPAGSTLARELSNTDLRIVLLESGGFDRQKHTDALNEIENVGRPRAIDQWFVRNRIVGGTSHTWTGRCAPFDEIDLLQRPWIPDSGWPFTLDHLLPYLDRSADHLGLGIGTGFNDSRFWKLAGRKPPAKEAAYRNLLPFFWQASRDSVSRRDYMRFGRHLLKHLGDNVTLMTHSTVLRINTDPAGDAVTSVDVTSKHGPSRRITASTVVLCAGAIENARLLLLSRDVMKSGLGNQNDLVGRFLMDHPRDSVGFFPKMSRGLQKRYGSYRVTSASGDNDFQRGLRLSPRLQREEGLVNCSAFFRASASQDDPWNALVRLLNGSGNRLQDAAIIASDPARFVRASHNYFLSRNGMPHKLERLELICMCEQVPDPNSRVTLAEKCDAFCMPIARLDWRSHEMESRTVRRMAQLIAQEFDFIGEEVPVLNDWIDQGKGFPASSFLDVAHPTGTTRMSDDATRGVVDRDCKVHGMRGLYIAGSSVFPTSGHCNPTQTIVAMAIRLADTLKLRSAKQDAAIEVRSI